jgi:transposase
MTDILNLTGWSVLEVQEIDSQIDGKPKKKYLITGEATTEPSNCPNCGACKDRLYRYGSNEQQIADTPIHGRTVKIQVKSQRWLCRECKKTFYQQLPEVDEKRRSTCRLVNHIKPLSLDRPFTSIAEDVDVDEKTVRNIFNDYVDWLDETVIFETPEYLGVDEIHLKRHRDAFGIMTNIEHHTVVDLLKNRSKKTVARRIFDMKDRNRIKVVVIDMWQHYKDAAQEIVPQAAVVVDKYHVVSMANGALETLRRGFKEQIPEDQRRLLKRERYILLKRRQDLTPKDILLKDAWFGLPEFAPLAIAYGLKEAFYDIFDLESRKEAEKAYQEWKQAISPDLKDFFFPLTRAVDNWHHEIFNYFDYQVTNGYTEAANSVARSIDREGRGHSFRVIRAKLLYNMKNHKFKETPKMTTTKGTEEMLIAAEGEIKTYGPDICKICDFRYFCSDANTITADQISTISTASSTGSEY